MRICSLLQLIQKIRAGIEQYDKDLSNATTKKEITRINKNITNNNKKLTSLLQDYEQLGKQTSSSTSANEIPLPDSDDEFEGSGMPNLFYRGGAKDTNSQVIKVANNLIYIMREASLFIQEKLYPVARILNPIQLETLRKVKAEIDTLNNIPQLEGKTERSLGDAITQLIENFNSIV